VNIKSPILSSAVVILSAVSPLIAAPDYAALNQVVSNYFAALDVLMKQVPTVDTASGTADVINAWSLANEIFANAGERFTEENPDVLTQTQPPSEFAAAFSRLSRLKTDYAPLPAKVGVLVHRFHDDPDVSTAFERFQKSLVRVQHAGEPKKK